MPIHDWTRVDSGLFHAFHQNWIGVLERALNAGVLPPDYFALREQSAKGPVPDGLTLELPSGRDESNGADSGLAVAVAPPGRGWYAGPKTQFMFTRPIGSRSDIGTARWLQW